MIFKLSRRSAEQDDPSSTADAPARIPGASRSSRVFRLSNRRLRKWLGSKRSTYGQSAVSPVQRLSQQSKANSRTAQVPSAHDGFPPCAASEAEAACSGSSNDHSTQLAAVDIDLEADSEGLITSVITASEEESLTDIVHNGDEGAAETSDEYDRHDVAEGRSSTEAPVSLTTPSISTVNSIPFPTMETDAAKQHIDHSSNDADEYLLSSERRHIALLEGLKENSAVESKFGHIDELLFQWQTENAILEPSVTVHDHHLVVVPFSDASSPVHRSADFNEQPYTSSGSGSSNQIATPAKVETQYLNLRRHQQDDEISLSCSISTDADLGHESRTSGSAASFGHAPDDVEDNYLDTYGSRTLSNLPGGKLPRDSTQKIAMGGAQTQFSAAQAAFDPQVGPAPWLPTYPSAKALGKRVAFSTSTSSPDQARVQKLSTQPTSILLLEASSQTGTLSRHQATTSQAFYSTPPSLFHTQPLPQSNTEWNSIPNETVKRTSTSLDALPNATAVRPPTFDNLQDEIAHLKWELSLFKTELWACQADWYACERKLCASQAEEMRLRSDLMEEIEESSLLRRDNDFLVSHIRSFQRLVCRRTESPLQTPLPLTRVDDCEDFLLHPRPQTQVDKDSIRFLLTMWDESMPL